MASPAMTSVHCELCGLPAGTTVYKGLFDGLDKLFCCHGCLHVFTILRESGALQAGVDPRDTELFRKSLAAGLVSQPEDVEIAEEAGESLELALQVNGMWCASCAWLIEHMLRKERGVLAAEVLFASDLVKVRYLPQRMPPGQGTLVPARRHYKGRFWGGLIPPLRSHCRSAPSFAHSSAATAFAGLRYNCRVGFAP